MLIKWWKSLKQIDFKNEKELQSFFENNLDIILWYDFIATEFSVWDFRMDSLAFDNETKSFRIIEYKNIKNHSLIDQWFTYLNLLLDNKADFVLKYNEMKDSKLKKDDVDRSQSRIIFVSPIFSQYQLWAINKALPLELIKVSKYEWDIIEIESITSLHNTKINEIINNESYKKVSKEIVVYTEENLLKKCDENILDLYSELRNRILSSRNLDVVPQKHYVAFKTKNKNVVDFEFFKQKLNLTINIKFGELEDPWNLCLDYSNKWHHWNWDYIFEIKDDSNINKALFYIEQAYKKK